jgi:hypothetical protein
LDFFLLFCLFECYWTGFGSIFVKISYALWHIPLSHQGSNRCSGITTSLSVDFTMSFSHEFLEEQLFNQFALSVIFHRWFMNPIIYKIKHIFHVLEMVTSEYI